MNKGCLCPFPIFALSLSISTNIFQEGEELEYDFPGYRVDRCGKISRVLIGVNQAESPSQEVKTKMALHSEVEAEEYHQEQGESAERRGGHDTSTWDTWEMKACQSPFDK